MSFQNHGFWMGKGMRFLNDGDMAFDGPSRIEPKRSHQMFMDGPEMDMFLNKKQAVEVQNSCIFSGMSNSSVSSWENAPCLPSVYGHLTEQLFDPEASPRPVNFDDGNILSFSADKLYLPRNENMDNCGNDSSFGLSMAHILEDSRSGLDYGGIRKVKVNQVKDSENVMHSSIGDACAREKNSAIAPDHTNEVVENSIKMGIANNKGDGNIISVADNYGGMGNNFISFGQSHRKKYYNLCMGKVYKENSNSVSVNQEFCKGDSGMISISQSCYKAGDSSMSTNLIFHEGEDNTLFVGSPHHKCENLRLSIDHAYNKSMSTIISFDGFDGDHTAHSGRLKSNCEMMMNEPPELKSDIVNNIMVANSLLYNNPTSVSVNELVSIKKEDVLKSKKIPSNNFPSNVRSLLSTGILDGVPVKYATWSREKELRGVIKGSGYSCGCQSCNYSKVINAYEFERHAGCKTKHPNNRIYFENGKTIYGIVQELKSTPQNMLFDVMQTITGSPINQKSFRLWKESFLAAALELQRIYRWDEGKQP